MQSNSTEFSIWQYVHCSVCMALFLPPNRPNPVPDTPFWVTDCGHVICNSHLKADQSCAACGSTGITCVSLQQHNMSSPISQWFVPISESHERLAVAASVQRNMLVELIEYYKNKYGAAKAMIARLQGEVKTLQQQLEVQQSHQPAAHLPLDQRSIHDSGYSSGNSGGPKRRRVDVESSYYVGQGGGSSPRSIHTPVVSSRFAPSGAGGSTAAEGGGSLASSSTRYGGQPTSHRIASNQSGGQVRSINAEQYAYIPPSTPINPQTTGRSAHSRGGLVSGSKQQQVTSRGAAMMPPPPFPRQQLGGASAVQTAAPNFAATEQSTTKMGQSRSSAQTFTSRFRSGSTAPGAQNGFQNEGLGGVSGSGASLFSNVGDGRRFVPRTPMSSKGGQARR